MSSDVIRLAKHRVITSSLGSFGAGHLSTEQIISDREGALNALLADYAAGHLNPALHSLVGAHLSMRPENRAFVASLEAVHAQELDEEAAPLANRAILLDKIFASPARRAPAIRRDADQIVPTILQSYIGAGIDDVKWRSVLPGLKEYRITDKASNVEASLLRIRPGRRLPSHTHEGTEVTLVLKGGFTDAGGHYCRGDIAIADGEVDHRPRADEHEECICFAVTDAPLRLTGPLGRIWHHLTGH